MENKKSIGTWLMEGLLNLSGSLPLGYHRWWARRIAHLMHGILHYRQDVVMANLARSFPEMSYEDLKANAKRFYLHFANTLTEMIWFGACKGEKGRKRLHDSHIVEITNPEELNRLYGGARQLMILQSHTGNWELIGGITNYSYGAPLDIRPDAFAVTYMKIQSPLWNRLMADNRTAPVQDQGFDGYVENYNILRFALSHKDQKFGYSFITDQYPYIRGHRYPKVEFMHQDTLTMTAPASLACKLEMAVAYLRFECLEEGGYRMTFVPICENAKEQDPEIIMKQYYSLLEQDLNAQPWNYLWTHKRWKKESEL